jgi:hypothetical protein
MYQIVILISGQNRNSPVETIAGGREQQEMAEASTKYDGSAKAKYAI